jgi:polysaccharide biosynthesis transport protein
MDAPAPLRPHHSGSGPGPLTVGFLARILWQRKWSALVVAILVGYGIHYASSFIVPQYLALATLRLDTGGRGTAVVESSSGLAEQTLLNTQRDLLLSSKVLKRAYESGPLSRNPAYQAGVNPVELFANRLTVEVSRDSYRITVSFRDEDGKRAEQALDGLVAAFLHEQAAQQVERTANELSFHTEQVELSREKLNQARARERELREKHALISANPEDNFAAARLTTLNAQRTLLDQRLASSTAVLTQLTQVDKDHPAPAAGGFSSERVDALLTIPDIAKDPLVVDLQKSVAGLRSDEARLSPVYLPKHPKMKEVLDALTFKQGELAKTVEASRTRLTGEREVLDRESTALNGQIAEAKTALTSYRNAQLEVQAQAEETRTQEVLFQQALARLSEKDLASRREGAKMSPMDPALALPFPINIRPRTFLAVSIALGFLAGIGVALALNAIDQRVRSHAVAEDLTRLPIIGRLPYIRRLPSVKQGSDLPEFQQLQEAYRDLRTALRLYRKGDGCQVLGVVSCGPGEGKTTVAAFLATSLAEANIRVLLIDGDLRRPTLHTVMEEDGTQGLGSLLSGDANDCVPNPTTLPKLDFMGAGVSIANPAELLHSRQLPELMAHWRTLYDYIIIDTSPLGLVSDALLFGELADGLLWVVRDRVTRKDVIRQVREVLAPLASRLLGCVYNGDATYRSRYGYGHMTYGKTPVRPDAAVAARG